MEKHQIEALEKLEANMTEEGKELVESFFEAIKNGEGLGDEQSLGI